MEFYTKATTSLNKATEMVDKLEFENNFYLEELETMEKTKNELSAEIDELNDAIDSLCYENNQLEKDNHHARRSFTALQLSISILVFAYGLFYGAYVARCA